MKIAIITGANRGIGLEFAVQLKAKDYYIIGCCREPEKALDLKKVANELIKLDVRKDADISLLQEQIKDRPVDLLVNNAGISGDSGVTIGNVNRENFLNVLDVNCVSVIKLSEALLPNIQKSNEKSIIVISSQMGSISDNQMGRSYAYRSSKAALNCVMRSFAIDVKDLGVHVMLLHPGWVQTDMGGDEATTSVESSVRGMLNEANKYLASSHAEHLHRFDGGQISW